MREQPFFSLKSRMSWRSASTISQLEDLQLSQSALTEEALDFDEQERKINRERILWALKQCNGIKRDAAKRTGNMSPTSWMSRRSWISIEEPMKKRLERAAEHAKRKLFTRPLHKTPT